MNRDATTIFADIDSFDVDRFVAHLTPDVTFRFGNADPIHGRDAVREAVLGFWGTIDGLTHPHRHGAPARPGRSPFQPKGAFSVDNAEDAPHTCRCAQARVLVWSAGRRGRRAERKRPRISWPRAQLALVRGSAAGRPSSMSATACVTAAGL